MKDGHVHSPYCLHGSKDSFQTYIEKAIASGIEEISFTSIFLFQMDLKILLKKKIAQWIWKVLKNILMN